MATSKWDCL